MILRRYVLRRVFGRTLFVLLASTVLYIIVDVMAVSQQLTRGSMWQVVQLYIFRLPEILVLMLPAALVMGPLLAMGSLAKRYELAAIKFTGGSMRRVVAPAFMLVGAGAAALLLFLNEVGQPTMAPAAVSLQNSVFKLRGPRFWSFYWPRRWVRTPSGFLHASSVSRGKLNDVTYVQHDHNFQPRILIRAETLREQEQGYMLDRAYLQDLSNAELGAHAVEQLPFPEHLDPGSLVQHLGYPEVFTAIELTETVRMHEAQGGQTTPFKLALWRRLGDPLLLLTLAFLVIPVGSWSRRGQPTERRLIEGAVILGVYFMVRGVFGSLASSETSACALAALGPAGVVLLLGALCWIRTEHERALP